MSPSRRRFAGVPAYIWLAAWLGWMTWIFVLSAQESPPVPRSGFSWEDKVQHAITYAVLAFLTLRVAERAARRRGAAVATYAFAFVWAALYGLSDEWHQGFVPGRDASAADWLADAAGAALVVVAIGLWRRAQVSGRPSRR